MGTAIAGRFSDGGATVESISQSDEPSAFGDIVVLAVPYAALPEIAEKYRDQLSDKTVVDITNPVDFATFTPSLTTRRHRHARHRQTRRRVDPTKERPELITPGALSPAT